MKKYLETQEIEELVGNFRGNLERGRAGATGIGFFVAVIEEGFNEVQTRILLRTREEKDSLFGDDLSGKWELPGGGLEINDFRAFFMDDSPRIKYTIPILIRLKQELREETGIRLNYFFEPITMFPALLYKDSKIDLAFVVPLDFAQVLETETSRKLMKEGKIRFFTGEELKQIEFIGGRMKFLVEQAMHNKIKHGVDPIYL